MSQLTEALDMLQQVKAEYDEANSKVKELKEEYDRLAIEIVPKLMEEQGFDSIKRGDKLIYLRNDLYANVDAAERGALAAALREIDQADLITEYVFPRTLTAWAKDRLEAGQSIPPQVNLRSVTRAVPRKA